VEALQIRRNVENRRKVATGRRTAPGPRPFCTRSWFALSKVGAAGFVLSRRWGAGHETQRERQHTETKRLTSTAPGPGRIVIRAPGRLRRGRESPMRLIGGQFGALAARTAVNATIKAGMCVDEPKPPQGALNPIALARHRVDEHTRCPQ